jgi:hypothetical protein
MRLDVTSAKMRKRLVVELSAQPNAHARENAPLHPEQAQPPQTHDPERPGERQAQLVKWTQAALSVLLGLRLPLDGVLGATTQMAVRRFQTQAGVPQTGALDEATLQALSKAIGHPAPGMTGEHKLMPRWFRLERHAPKPKPKPTLKKLQDHDAPQQEPHAALAKQNEAMKPAPALPEAAHHKKRRLDAAHDKEQS